MTRHRARPGSSDGARAWLGRSALICALLSTFASGGAAAQDAREPEPGESETGTAAESATEAGAEELDESETGAAAGSATEARAEEPAGSETGASAGRATGARAGDPGAPRTTGGEPGRGISAPVRGPGDRHAVLDYDGLPAPGPTPEEILIWIPRIALLPLHLVTDWVIRRPLGAFFSWLEREHVIEGLVGFFTWDHFHAGLVPTAFFDFGLLPSVGLYFFWNDAGAPGHQFRARASFGGVDYVRASVTDRVLLAPSLELSFDVAAWRMPDRIYQGVGAESRTTDRARYRQDAVDAAAELAFSFWRRSLVRLDAGVRAMDFSSDGYDPNGVDPSLAAALESGRLNAPPPGFGGYAAYRQRLRFTLDSREEAPADQHGVRVDANVEQAFDLRAGPRNQWIRYGGALSGYLDAGAERVFSLHVHAELADPIAGEIPFTELPRLGDATILLPAFLPGALIGRSAVAATLRYRWPIWVQLDGSLFVGAGNVYGEHFRDFRLEALRLSWGISLQSVGDRDYSFRITFALGTRPIDQGGDIESVRFTLGSALGL